MEGGSERERKRTNEREKAREMKRKIESGRDNE
jgi:hypothetical protein